MQIHQEDSYIKEAPVLPTMCVNIQRDSLICNIGTCLLSCQRKKENEEHQRRNLLVIISNNMSLYQRDSKSISVSQSYVNLKKKDPAATVEEEGACSTLWVDSLYLLFMGHLRTQPSLG